MSDQTPPELAVGQDDPPDVDAVIRASLVLLADVLDYLHAPLPDDNDAAALDRRTAALRRVLVRLRDYRAGPDDW